MINSKMVPRTIDNVNDSKFITCASGALLKANQNEACDGSLCITKYEFWDDRFHLSGLLILFIALIFALIILLNQNLHSASTKNAVFMILTSIIMSIAVALLNPRGSWYEHVLAAAVPTLVTIFAIVMGLRLKYSAQKRMMLFFTFCCLLLASGIAFSVAAAASNFPYKLIFAILSFICWCSGMLFFQFLAGHKTFDINNCSTCSSLI
ncbi:unnamed protein product [Schistosoma turkestanicum]|nr:unnamed protein product [Schistosoma turkestanicum]